MSSLRTILLVRNSSMFRDWMINVCDNSSSYTLFYWLAIIGACIVIQNLNVSFWITLIVLFRVFMMQVVIGKANRIIVVNGDHYIFYPFKDEKSCNQGIFWNRSEKAEWWSFLVLRLLNVSLWTTYITLEAQKASHMDYNCEDITYRIYKLPHSF